MKIRSKIMTDFTPIFAVLPELQNEKLLTIDFSENQ